jgi:hypothetical protein
MATITKTKSVLHADRHSERTFVQRDEDSGVLRRKVYLDITTYQDLGSPDTVTVTVEPGDTLNV